MVTMTVMLITITIKMMYYHPYFTDEEAESDNTK